MNKIIEKQDFESINSPTVQKITQTIIMSWKRSVFSLLVTGRCLKQLKKILSRQDFLTVLEAKLGISEMHAHRLMRLFETFGDSPNDEILSAKPSVLYQISSSIDTSDGGMKALKQLFKGKKINELTIQDVKTVTHKKTAKLRIEDPPHREILTLLIDIVDEVNRVKKIAQKNPIKQEVLKIKESLKEAIDCLKELNSVL